MLQKLKHLALALSSEMVFQSNTLAKKCNKGFIDQSSEATAIQKHLGKSFVQYTFYGAIACTYCTTKKGLLFHLGGVFGLPFSEAFRMDALSFTTFRFCLMAAKASSQVGYCPARTKHAQSVVVERPRPWAQCTKTSPLSCAETPNCAASSNCSGVGGTPSQHSIKRYLS